MFARGSLGMNRPNKQWQCLREPVKTSPRQNALDKAAKTLSQEYEKTLVVQRIFKEGLFHINIPGKFCLMGGLTSLIGNIHCTLYARAKSLKITQKIHEFCGGK